MIMIVTGHDRWVWLVVMMDVAMWGLDSRCGYMVGVALWWVWQLCWVVMIGGCGSCAVRLYFVVW